MNAVVEWIVANRTLLIVLGLIALAFLALRTQQSALPESGLDSLAAPGKPVVLEVFSNT
jgi:hypothetical protein